MARLRGLAMIVSIRVRDPALQEALEEAARWLGCDARPLRDVRDVGTDPTLSSVLLDDELPNLAELVSSFRAALPAARLVVLSSRSDVRALVDALGLGVEVLRKPIDMDDLREALRAGPSLRDPTLGIETCDEGMRELLRTLAQVATSDLTVCLCGESGSGRSLLARSLHRHSARGARVLVELSALELHEALTRSRSGARPEGDDAAAIAALFGRAQGGSVVLDGIDELSAGVQEALASLLERRDGRAGHDPRGESRVVAISNRPLVELASSGLLLPELADRLGVVCVRVPPLRERLGDLAPLAEQMLQGFADELGRPAARLGREAEALLRQRPWRGNVRELENLMARAAVVFPGQEIRLDWVDSSLESACTPAAPELNLKQLERTAIARALDLVGGKRVEAARVLGISVRTLRNKIQRYELA